MSAEHDLTRELVARCPRGRPAPSAHVPAPAGGRAEMLTITSHKAQLRHLPKLSKSTFIRYCGLVGGSLPVGGAEGRPGSTAVW